MAELKMMTFSLDVSRIVRMRKECIREMGQAKFGYLQRSKNGHIG